MKISVIDGTRNDFASCTEDLATFAGKGPLVTHTFPGIDWWADAPRVSDRDAAQAGDFREHGSELADLGYRILGISTQPVGELHKWARRERIRYFLASDEELGLAEALALPTARYEAAPGYKHPRHGRVRVYQRLVLIVRAGRITKVFYPVKEPDHAAEQVLSWLYEAERRR